MSKAKIVKFLGGKGCKSGSIQQPNYTKTVEEVPTILPRREGKQKTVCAYGGGPETTSSGSTSKVGYPGGTSWALSTWQGPAGAAVNIPVLAYASTAAICLGYGDTCENMTLLFKMSIIVPVLRDRREVREGPSLFSCRACLVFVMLGGRGTSSAQNHMQNINKCTSCEVGHVARGITTLAIYSSCLSSLFFHALFCQHRIFLGKTSTVV